jgi:chromosome segregation ATPase
MSNLPTDESQLLISSLSRQNPDMTEITQRLDTLAEENKTIKHENQTMKITMQQLLKQVDQLQSCFNTSQQVMATYDERHATILSELEGLKESMRNSQPQHKQAVALPEETSMRSIPAPSKVLIDDQKKKDNRLVELRRITKEYMHVDDGEAALRLYKLQKTMIHVVSDLKKYMKTRNEDISKSWKSIDMSTQRVAFEMVEREASGLGVPLNMCIGYWGARRLISKSWANALRTTKKHIRDGKKKKKKKKKSNKLFRTR